MVDTFRLRVLLLLLIEFGRAGFDGFGPLGQEAIPAGDGKRALDGALLQLRGRSAVGRSPLHVLRQLHPAVTEHVLNRTQTRCAPSLVQNMLELVHSKPGSLDGLCSHDGAY